MLIVRYILLQPEVEGDISFATNRGHFISLLQGNCFALTKTRSIDKLNINIVAQQKEKI